MFKGDLEGDMEGDLLSSSGQVQVISGPGLVQITAQINFFRIWLWSRTTCLNSYPILLKIWLSQFGNDFGVFGTFLGSCQYLNIYASLIWPDLGKLQFSDSELST